MCVFHNLLLLLSNSDCLRFAFMHIIKKEIEQVALEWNNHSIRHSSYAVVPNGSPEELFFMPSILGIIGTSTSYLCKSDILALRDRSNTLLTASILIEYQVILHYDTFRCRELLATCGQ